VIVQPAWVDTEEVASTVDTVDEIDPGRAFGSGGHETTQLALALLLDELASRPPGARVLDVGCGSGVLGIAAAMVARAAVVAVDTDPDAIPVTVDNARRNHVGGLLHASATPLHEVDGTFDVVVANILAVTLRELLPELAARVAPNGALILSGMLAEQAAEVHRCATASGLWAGGERSDGGWSAVRFTS
jgi:ribosomal protein L11 methyltransferase